MCALGDLNYDILTPDKCHTLKNIMDTCSLKNLVKEPTCFTKSSRPSLIDVILTNSPNLLCNTINFDCGLSDCHTMVATTFKENSISNKRHKITFRRYKNFQEADFIRDLNQAPFHISALFDDANDCYWAYEILLMDIVDEHAPRKQKYPKNDPPPFMNSDLRKAIYKKKMLHNKYHKFRNSTNWELYRKQRNYVTKLRKQSIKLYFFERCGGGPKSKVFWPTIKPFLSSKSAKMTSFCLEIIP